MAGSDTEPEAGPSTPPRYARPTMLPFIDGRGETLAYRTYRSEDDDLPGIQRLCEEELSEPYNVYTFRYFLVEWPHLTFFVYPTPDDTDPIATIICKLEQHRERTNRGYIGMLSVDSRWRRRGIARKLVELAVAHMDEQGADEIVLETEYDNKPSLALYEALGFVREKRLHRFYSNGKDAFRLILPLSRHPWVRSVEQREEKQRLAELQTLAVPVGSEQTSVSSAPPSSKPNIPSAIAFVLAGPRAAFTRPETEGMARLSIDAPPPPRRTVPDYIM